MTRSQNLNRILKMANLKMKRSRMKGIRILRDRKIQKTTSKSRMKNSIQPLAASGFVRVWARD